MCWQCDHPEGDAEDYLRQVVLPTIDQCGWLVQAVGGSRLYAPFAYTVGLTGRGLPELVVTGLRAEPAAALLNAVAQYCCDRLVLLPGETICVGSGPSCEAVGLPHPDVHLFTAVDVYGERVRALQLVWADSRGRYPWEAGHRAGRGGQPVLGPREAWRVAG